jgi:3D (Asp-Asp-Asp) domain-containing protein
VRLVGALALLFSITTGTVNAARHTKIAQHCVRQNVGNYRITAYLPTGNRTATGIWPYYGEVAVDPNLVPLGSRVHIVGLGNFSAQDTGGAVWGYHLDVFVYNMTQAYAVQGNGYRIAWWCRN